MAFGATERAEIELSARDRKLARDLRRADKRLKKFGRSVSQSVGGGFRSGFGQLAALGTAGGLASIGGEVLDYEDGIARLGIQSGKSREYMAAFGASLRDISDDTGISAKALQQGASRFVSLTGDMDSATTGAVMFAKVAAASGATMEDVTATTASLRDNLQIDPRDFERAFSILLTQGKAGAIELRELATLLSGVAPQFTRFGVDGVRGMAELGASIQVVRKGFGTATEAATGIRAMMTALSRNAARFQAAGVRIFDRDPKTGAKRFRQLSAIVNDLSRSKLIKDPTALTKAFGSSEAERSFQELAKNQDLFRELFEKSLTSNAVQDDFAAYMASSSGRIHRTWERVQNSLARQLTPERIEAIARAFELLARGIGFAAEHAGELLGLFAGVKLAQGAKSLLDLAGAGAKLGGAAGGISRFGVALGKLGMVAGVGALSYELGTLLDNALGISDWIAGIEDTTPKQSKNDPTGRASVKRIEARQARAFADDIVNPRRRQVGASFIPLTGFQGDRRVTDDDRRSAEQARRNAQRLEREAFAVESAHWLSGVGTDAIAQMLTAELNAVPNVMGLDKVIAAQTEALVRELNRLRKDSPIVLKLDGRAVATAVRARPDVRRSPGA